VVAKTRIGRRFGPSNAHFGLSAQVANRRGDGGLSVAYWSNDASRIDGDHGRIGNGERGSRRTITNGDSVVRKDNDQALCCLQAGQSNFRWQDT
jgi:hypothetical protein